MKRLVLSALLALVCISGASAQTYLTEKGISYRTEQPDSYADSICKLDIYYPSDSKGFPTVIWFHGGGLTHGKRTIPEELKNNGFAVIGAGYRFHPRATLDAIIDDAAAASAWVVANITRYGGDASKIYLAGHSAGGYLISMIGLDKKWLSPYGIDPDDTFAAMIPYSGQSINHFVSRQAKGIRQDQPFVDEMAPMYHVRPDCVPILIISGDRELEMYGRYEENAYLWRMFQVVGHTDARILELDGFNHSGMAKPGHLITIKYIKDREKSDTRNK